MGRYIDAEKIKITADTMIEDGECYVPLSAVKQAIARTPTEDVEEIRNGHWIDRRIPNDTGTLVFVCSVCGGKPEWNRRNYCPNCGAKMDGKE